MNGYFLRAPQIKTTFFKCNHLTMSEWAVQMKIHLTRWNLIWCSIYKNMRILHKQFKWIGPPVVLLSSIAADVYGWYFYVFRRLNHIFQYYQVLYFLEIFSDLDFLKYAQYSEVRQWWNLAYGLSHFLASSKSLFDDNDPYINWAKCSAKSLAYKDLKDPQSTWFL